MHKSIQSLKVIRVLWYREFLHYWRDKIRVVTSMAMPLGFLIFGRGVSSIVGNIASDLLGPNVNFLQFLFPGIIGLAVFFVSISSGASVIWDREFGFLRAILIAPISRTEMAVGKIAGGATIAMIQGSIMLLVAPFIGIQLTPLLVLQLWILMLLTAFSLTAAGMFVGSLLHTTEAYEMIIYAFAVPLAMLSGAYFPLKDLPRWMNFLVKINPLTYAIDAFRQTIFHYSQITLQINIFGSPIMGIFGDILVVIVFSLVMTELAIWAFSRSE